MVRGWLAVFNRWVATREPLKPPPTMAIVVGVWAVKKLRFMALKLLFSPILTPIPVQGYLTRKYYSAYC